MTPAEAVAAILADPSTWGGFSLKGYCDTVAEHYWVFGVPA